MPRGQRLKDALFAPSRIGRHEALTRMERLSALTHLSASAEYLSQGSGREPGGYNDWEVIRDEVRVRSRLGRAILETASQPKVTQFLHGVKIAASAVLISPVRNRRVRLGANAVLTGASLALYPRQRYGADGSDQVSLVVQALSTLGRGFESRPRRLDAALWAVSLQSTLSYAVSGWVKVAGPKWGTGEAVTGVARTRSFGDESTWQLARRWPKLAQASEIAVVGLECASPVVYLAGGRLTKSYVAAATVLHLAIAKVMALGRFVTSFTSMHPAVLYTGRPSSYLVEPDGPRSDTVPRVALVGGAVVAAAAAASQVSTRRAVLNGHGDERTFTTSDGNTLAYRLRGRTEGDGPLFFLENALLSSPDYWEWIAAELGRSGPVLTYHRAGHGPSSWSPPTAMALDDLAREAAELVDEVGEDRPVVLVGHSLGGYLAMKTALRIATDVTAVVVVDSAHPQELDRSPRQRMGAIGLRADYDARAKWLGAGFGILAEVPFWMSALPSAAQPQARAQRRDARMWRAAVREWDATLREFQTRPDLPTLPCPVHAITADATQQDDDVMHELHAEMVAAGAPGGRHEVIAGSDHQSILTARRFALPVAEIIAESAAEARLPEAP